MSLQRSAVYFAVDLAAGIAASHCTGCPLAAELGFYSIAERHGAVSTTRIYE